MRRQTDCVRYSRRAHAKTSNSYFRNSSQTRGGSRIFSRRGCTHLLLYSTPINHIFFFLQNTSCIRKLQVISGEGGAHPLHPPPRSAPANLVFSAIESSREENCSPFWWFNGLFYALVQKNLLTQLLYQLSIKQQNLAYLLEQKTF